MNYYSLIPSAPSYNPAAFSSCCRISSANHCGCRTLNHGEMRCSCGLFGGGSADIDEPYNPSKVEMTPLWRLFDRRRFIFEYKTKDKSIENLRIYVINNYFENFNNL